jgi:hypothetical protein
MATGYECHHCHCRCYYLLWFDCCVRIGDDVVGKGVLGTVVAVVVLDEGYYLIEFAQSLVVGYYTVDIVAAVVAVVVVEEDNSMIVAGYSLTV